MSVKRNTLKPAAAKAPRRRPAQGGYQRGEQVRARIIDAALIVFAEDGYSRATTRRIASEAQVSTPALQYYFNSKEGLHGACGAFVVERLKAVMDPALDRAPAALAQGDPTVCANVLWGLLDTYFQTVLSPDTPPAWSRFLMRTQADAQGPAYLLAARELHAPIYSACVNLCARAANPPPDDVRSRILALLILNMLATFSVNGDSAWTALGWSELNDERRATLSAVFKRAVYDLLGRPADDRVTAA